MCLRKAMFRPDVGARLLAVRGFLFLVLQELRAPDAMPYDENAASSSQVCMHPRDSLNFVHLHNRLQSRYMMAKRFIE